MFLLEVLMDWGEPGEGLKVRILEGMKEMSVYNAVGRRCTV